MAGRVTIKDVAREAGVSTATVSYVIHGKESLSEDTIRRVNDAIQRLHYVPHLSARSLASNRSHFLGVVIPQTEPNRPLMFDNPFYSEFLSGVEYTARSNGYHVIISGEDMDESYLEICKKRNLDGVVVLGMYPDEFYYTLKEANISIVLVDSYCQDGYFHSVQIDDEHGGYIAAKYLIDKGHRYIALLTGNIEKDGVSRRRYLGYRRALNEAGIPFSGDDVFQGPVEYAFGMEMAEPIMKKDSYTAVFASADIVAIGLAKALKAKGVRIPEDISLMGFDDLSITKLIDTPLTTVKQGIYQKGEAAVNMLIECIEKKETKRQEITLPIHILERASVKDLPER